MDYFEFNKAAKEIPIFGVGLHKISRKRWVRNWRTVVHWTLYMDYLISDAEPEISRYCEANDIPFMFDCGYFHCISNRKQYNDIFTIWDYIFCQYCD